MKQRGNSWYDWNNLEGCFYEGINHCVPKDGTTYIQMSSSQAVLQMQMDSQRLFRDPIDIIKAHGSDENEESAVHSVYL